jgi:hypothetical protein
MDISARYDQDVKVTTSTGATLMQASVTGAAQSAIPKTHDLLTV